MQATRQAILDYLRVHREATVRDLSAHLDLTTTGVRQHLTVLEREGLVQYRDLRGRVGRPALAYSLTDEAEKLYPKRYDRLAVALLQAAEESLDGQQFHDVLDSAATRLFPSLNGASAGTVRQRVEALAERFRADGMVVEVEDDDGELRLLQYACPFLEAAKASDTVCILEAQAFRAVTGADVEVSPPRGTGESRTTCTMHFRLPERALS